MKGRKERGWKDRGRRRDLKDIGKEKRELRKKGAIGEKE